MANVATFTAQLIDQRGPRPVHPSRPRRNHSRRPNRLADRLSREPVGSTSPPNDRRAARRPKRRSRKSKAPTNSAPQGPQASSSSSASAAGHGSGTPVPEVEASLMDVDDGDRDAEGEVYEGDEAVEDDFDLLRL